MVGKTLFGESSRVEFKEAMPQKHERFLKDIIAFANTAGGKCVLGVVDGTGEVVGIGEKNPFKLSDAITNMIADSCTPQINTEITIMTLEEKTILEVEVFPGRYRPYYLKAVGKETSSYIRVNGTSRPADERRLRELELEGSKLSYDAMPEIGESFDEAKCKALCQRMYETALSACKTDAERDEIKPMTIGKLEDLSLLYRNGRELQPTHGFRLLTDPKEGYVKIQCALFKGVDREIFIDRKEFTGPIQDQVESAYQFVLKHIDLGAEISGLYRRDLYELPTQSIREVIANAVLHRSYLDTGSIQVSIYDDRVEVDSPGMLYDGLTAEDAVRGKSKCRNTAIAEAFRYMKIIEAWGTGLPRLYRQCREMGLKEPTFREFGDGIKVTIYRREASDKASDKASDNEKQAIKRALTSNRAEEIREYISDHGQATTEELAKHLGLSAQRTRAILSKMEEVEAIGANRNRRYRLRGQS